MTTRTVFIDKAQCDCVSLRDYFAAAALQCIASRFMKPADIVGQAIPVAEDAYKIADAMLAEREKGCAP